MCVACKRQSQLTFRRGTRGYFSSEFSLLVQWPRAEPRVKRSLAPVVPKVWVATKAGVAKCQKMGRAEAIQTRLVDFPRCRCLPVSVFSADS